MLVYRKKYLGWDFFYIYFSPRFIEALLCVYPDIDKQEANSIEDRFVIWLDQQFKKKNMKYNLKLSDIPFEAGTGASNSTLKTIAVMTGRKGTADIYTELCNICRAFSNF